MLTTFKSPLALCCLMLMSINSYAEQFNVLLFTKTQGYHHQSILDGVTAIRELANKHFFTMDWQEDAKLFTDENLKKYQVIIFLSTTGDIFNTGKGLKK